MGADPGQSRQIDGVKHLEVDSLPLDSKSILNDFRHYFGHTLGRRRIEQGSPITYEALVLTIRDRLTDRWAKTRHTMEAEDTRQVCYLSLEFLMGRLLRNAMLNLGIEQQCKEALGEIGIELADVIESEHDTGLGNGGLGRLAACFLDSCATLKLPVTGYGIRYHYGMFHQHIDNGYQVEEPDIWLLEGFPWEIERIEYAQKVQFGGHTEVRRDKNGNTTYSWCDTHDVLAVPFDVPIPGYRNDTVNTLRLWSAMATEEFNLEEFNAGSYTEAVAAKNAAENITMVLYPNAASENGQELRLRQQYFLASASLQDVLRRWHLHHGNDFSTFADKHCFQINDTHPSIAVAELMRLLMDRHGLGWDESWQITTSTMAYTNHTLLPEALEMWPVRMFRTLLPRVLDIIFEINARFLSEVAQRWPGDNERQRRMSLIDDRGEPMIRMAHLAIVGCFSVNGVAELHSRLLQQGLFRDFSEHWPDKFNNKTNGVTQRRWLAACNPDLSQLLNSTIGEGWITDSGQLARLRPFADQPEIQDRWREVKKANKRKLSELIRERCGLSVSDDMLFDVQVKRIHEYKRQLLNALHAIHLYARIKDGDDVTPRCIIIGGKAAPGYVMAKSIIKLINNVANVVNADPVASKLLQLVFVPDYNVSAMETICPAADVSTQISTAGKEASGTGNMKLMLNGAVTVGTLDGANVEIRDAVGADNFFLCGLNVDEIEVARRDYDPQSIIDSDPDLLRVIRLLTSSHFNRFEPGIHDDIIEAIRNPLDQWMTAADFRSYVDAQEAAGKAYRKSELWTRMSILNTAAAGRFSTDRTMQDYNSEIWRLTPLTS